MKKVIKHLGKTEDISSKDGENVGKAEILLRCGNKKRRRGGNSRNLTEMMER